MPTNAEHPAARGPLRREFDGEAVALLGAKGPTWTLENVKVVIDVRRFQAFAEYEFTAQSSKTGRTIHELFFGRLVAENGKIKLLRESVNLVEVALGVFRMGSPTTRFRRTHPRTQHNKHASTFEVANPTDAYRHPRRQGKQR